MKVFKTVTDKEMNHNGFHLTFANGCTISVMFGKYTYSDEGQTTAEVAAWDKNGDWMVWSEEKWVTLKEYQTDIMSHVTPDELSRMMISLSE